MTDETKGKRIEPRIGKDEDERRSSPADTPYTGSLFDDRYDEDDRSAPSDDDFLLNRVGSQPESDDDEPIIPNSDRIEIPAVEKPARTLPGSDGSLPIVPILAGAALLASLYALWAGSDVSQRISQLENAPRSQIEDVNKLQGQETEALTKQLAELETRLAGQEKLIEGLQKQNKSLEAALAKQDDKHKSDMTALMQGEDTKHKAMMQEISEQISNIQTSKSNGTAAAKPNAETPAIQVQTATPAPKPKPKPVVRQPAMDKTELPGPIESVAEVESSASSAATGRQPSWGVNVISLESKTAAQQEVARLKEAGIDAEILETSADGRAWYRVRVAGFASKEEAQQMQSTLAKEHGIQGTWVNKQ